MKSCKKREVNRKSCRKIKTLAGCELGNTASCLRIFYGSFFSFAEKFISRKGKFKSVLDPAVC